MTMHLAPSLCVRPDIQMARQTSQLHRMARANSASAGAFILAAATVSRYPLLECSIASPPPATNSAARTAQPARLPSHDVTMQASIWPGDTLPRSAPNGMIMAWLVKRSAPAKITKVSAMPKDAPMMSGR